MFTTTVNSRGEKQIIFTIPNNENAITKETTLSAIECAATFMGTSPGKAAILMSMMNTAYKILNPSD